MLQQIPIDPHFMPGALFIAATFAVFFLQCVGLIGGNGINSRELSSLPALVTAHFKHVSFRHVFGNALVTAALVWGVLSDKPYSSWITLVAIGFLAAALVWLFGNVRDGQGASLIGFGLVGWLCFDLVYGLRPLYAAIFIVALVLFGRARIKGMSPSTGSGQGHLAGFVAGVAMAWPEATGRLPWSDAYAQVD